MAKFDEFYTRYEDISNELNHYAEQMRGAHVICPCDWDESLEEVLVWASERECVGASLFTSDNQPNDNRVREVDIVRSAENVTHIQRELDTIKCQFVLFLVSHAIDWGIASIAVSGYDPQRHAGVRFQDIDYSRYDLCITNPPFSQIRQFIDTMFENDMRFLVIGPDNTITYKNVFPRIMENKMWLGYGFSGGNAYFRVSDPSKFSENVYDPDKDLVKFRNCDWFTNLDVAYRHDLLILTEEYDPDRYPTYVNYDAIEVGRVASIPADYDGKMGVPITFLRVYNPDQFEIIGTSQDLGKATPETTAYDNARGRKGGKDGAFYTKKNDEFKRVYNRLVIRNLHPEGTNQ